MISFFLFSFLFSRNLPTQVELEFSVLITYVKCGVDGTMFLTESGTLLACGR